MSAKKALTADDQATIAKAKKNIQTGKQPKGFMAELDQAMGEELMGDDELADTHGVIKQAQEEQARLHKEQEALWSPVRKWLAQNYEIKLVDLIDAWVNARPGKDESLDGKLSEQDNVREAIEKLSNRDSAITKVLADRLKDRGFVQKQLNMFPDKPAATPLAAVAKAAKTGKGKGKTRKGKIDDFDILGIVNMLIKANPEGVAAGQIAKELGMEKLPPKWQVALVDQGYLKTNGETLAKTRYLPTKKAV